MWFDCHKCQVYTGLADRISGNMHVFEDSYLNMAPPSSVLMLQTKSAHINISLLVFSSVAETVSESGALMVCTSGYTKNMGDRFCTIFSRAH